MRCTITNDCAPACAHQAQRPGGNYAVRPFVKIVALRPMAYSVEYLNSGIAFS
jgi:hypothetical protein